jgi:hypothetical protein
MIKSNLNPGDLKDAPHIRDSSKTKHSQLGRYCSFWRRVRRVRSVILHSFNRTLPSYMKIAFCIKEVAVSDSVAKYGLDTKTSIKFGSAQEGETFITDRVVDKRGIITANNKMTGVGMAFPDASFAHLNVIRPRT